MNYVRTPRTTKNPSWTNRNLEISKRISNDSNVLDLGCGSKDLLNYINPALYVGVDYHNADVIIDFNKDFKLPPGKWDYIVCSGVLEYLYDIDKFLKIVSMVPSTYIFSYWKKHYSLREPNNLPPYTMEDFISSLSKRFNIIETFAWRGHNIYLCQPKQ